jgi:hypothetical protein
MCAEQDDRVQLRHLENRDSLSTLQITGTGWVG